MTEIVYSGYQFRREKLLEWRNRYKKNIYSYKIAHNMFYDLYSLAAFWNSDEISNYLRQEDVPFLNILEANNYVSSMYRGIQVEIVQPQLESLMNEYPSIFGISWSGAQSRINKANNGNNKDVEEIEFAYIYYGTVASLVLTWLAFRFTGYKDEQAYLSVTGIEIGNREITSLEFFVWIYLQRYCLLFRY